MEPSSRSLIPTDSLVDVNDWDDDPDHVNGVYISDWEKFMVSYLKNSFKEVGRGKIDSFNLIHYKKRYTDRINVVLEFPSSRVLTGAGVNDSCG